MKDTIQFQKRKEVNVISEPSIDDNMYIPEDMSFASYHYFQCSQVAAKEKKRTVVVPSPVLYRINKETTIEAIRKITVSFTGCTPGENIEIGRIAESGNVKRYADLAGVNVGLMEVK
ncbi:hypothetical protein C5167_010875 [Papaver somniferum]|uniref:Uncharacterized protein n=1 Tax=Papaver somniferum TaxID=3469 RepID=A0A4Y7K5J4_PAPSO|nr:hypothetical protein C5167_010875 [Papaver somniferum]